MSRMGLKYPTSMQCHYTLPKDLNDRLDGTVCRYDGKIVRVYANGTYLDLYDWKANDKIKTILPDDPLLDISMIETGYFNYEGKIPFVGYITRNPLKKYKAALHHQYVNYLNIEGKTLEHFMPEGLYQPGILKSFDGEFPTYEEAMATLAKGSAEVAISIDIAFRKDDIGAIYVFYRTTPVGWIAPGGSKIYVIDNDLRWVVERYLSRSGLTL